MKFKLVKLGELCKMQSGGTPRRNIAEFYKGTIPWVKISDIEDAENGVIRSTEEHISDAGLKSINNRLFPKGTLLLAMYGSVGKTAILGSEMSTNQAILGIQVINQTTLNLKYLKHWFDFFKYELVGRARGVALQNISLSIVKDLEIPLPPLEEQKRIVEVLDKADRLRQKDRQLLAHYDQLLQSVFLDMFGDPVKNEKGWEEFLLKDVCIQITDGTHFSPPSADFGVPYITARHLRKTGLDFYRQPTYVSPEDHKVIYARCSPKKGDVLYIKDGATTGVAAINNYDFEFSMLSSLALIKPNIAKLNNQYLKNWLNNEQVKERLISTGMAGAAIKRFTLHKIKSFRIPLPPVEVQTKFSAVAYSIELQVKLLDKQAEASEKLFQSLLQKAFMGELQLKEVEAVEERLV